MEESFREDLVVKENAADRDLGRFDTSAKHFIVGHSKRLSAELFNYEITIAVTR